MPIPCHIVVEGNPAIVYASRNGAPEKMLLILEPLLKTFWQERDALGETHDTPECLVAQIVVRFGFEICEDDFSNLKVGLKYDPTVTYVYLISAKRELSIWSATDEYRSNPALGLKACEQLRTVTIG
ncbi:MAG TPA: histidine kinase [Leptolyngbya sp.]|nr:histidine kinase [Leptolyngbya sp.]